MAEIFNAKGTLDVIIQGQTQAIEGSLENLKKIVKSLEISPELKGDASAQIIKLEQTLNRINSIAPDQMTEELAQVILKQLQAVFKDLDKLNSKILDSALKSTGAVLKTLTENIQTLKKEIALAQKEFEIIEQKFPEVDPAALTGERKFSSQREETLFAKEALNPEEIEQLEKLTGKSRDNFADMWRRTRQVSDTVLEINGVNEKINSGLDQQKNAKEVIASLTEEERQALEKNLQTKRRGVTLEQAMEQALIRARIEKEKTKFLDEKQNEAAEKQNQFQAKKVKLAELEKRQTEELNKAQQQVLPQQKELLDLAMQLGENIGKGSTQGSVSMLELKESTNLAKRSKKEFNEETQKTQSTLAKATRQVFSYGIAFSALRRIYRETLRTVKDLDQALTEMAIVTSMNRKETWELVGTMQSLASETGFTTTEIAKLSTVYFRQGRTLREVIELTRVAAMGARIAGISAAQSADFLTSAVNAFQFSADQALEVSDRFAALAAQSASSYEELAVGLSKFAAQANIAGISIDFAMGLLAKGIETTREAPETIGTALKTVIARMRELTDLGKTFEDGMDISRVETALRQVGVALRDEQGQFRNLELVLTELGHKFATLNTNQQASVAVALAGTRQQSRLIAIMQDFDRTLQLVDIAQESAGATMAQHTQFMRGMEAATVGLQTAYQKFITTITDSEVIIGIVRGLSAAINGLANGLEAIGFSGQLATVSLIAMTVVLRSKKAVIALLTKQQEKLLTLEAAQNRLSILNNKIERAKILLKKQGIATEKVKRAQLILSNAQQEKTNLLASNNLILSKLKVFWDTTENKALIAKIRSYFSLGVAQKGAAKANLGFIATNKILMKSFIGLAKTILLTPIGWIAAAVFILIKGFRDLSEGNDTLAATFASSFTGILEAVKVAFSSIMDFVRALLTIGTNFGILKNVFFLPFMVVLKSFQVILDFITIVINLFSLSLIHLTDRLKGTIKQSKILSWALDIVLKTVEGLKNGFEAVREEAARSSEELRLLTSSYEDLRDVLQKTRKELQSENFELIQKNKTLEGLINRQKELNRLTAAGAISGSAFLEEEQNILRELENLDDDLVVRDFSGAIDIEGTIRSLEANRRENTQRIANNLFAIASEAVNLAGKDTRRFLSGEGGALEDVQNFLINLIDDDLTRDQVNALREYYKNLFETRIGTEGFTPQDLLQAGPDTAIQSLITGVSDFSSAVDQNEGGILGLKKAFEDIAKTMDTEVRDAFRSSFVDLTSVFDLLDGRTERTQQSMARVLNVVGRTPEALNRLVSSLQNTGISMEELLLVAGNLADNLQEANQISEGESVSQALIMIAGTLDDAAAAAQLYSLAVGRSLLEAAQAADLLANRINNLSDVQSKFLEGTLSDQEFFDFVENYSEFFGDPEFFSAFQNGLELSGFLIQDTIEQAEEYRTQLFAVTQQLKAAEEGVIELTDAQISALRAEQNRLLILNDYQGAFRGVTESQYEYNNALKAFELASRLGVDSTDLQIRKVNALQNNIGSALKLITKDLDTIDQNIDNILAAGDINQTADQIYEVVDGVVVLKDAYFDLAPEIRKALDAQLQFIEAGVSGIFEVFETLMNETLALEENLAKDRIKVYEDYFATLDRLEAQRERKVQRQDLVSQLARLEGATDERSRSRALDLRRELNQLDEKTSEETLKESRASLIESINESVELVRQQFQQTFEDFVGAGGRSGEALFAALQANGLVDPAKGWEEIQARFVVPTITAPTIPDVEFNQDQINEMTATIDALTASLSDPDLTPEEVAEIEDEIDLLIAQRDELKTISGLLKEGFNIADEVVTDDGNDHVGDPMRGHASGMEPVERTEEEKKAAARSEFNRWKELNQRTNLFGQKFDPDAIDQLAKREELYAKYGIDSFRKGGMVDYNGLAMLHGSKSSPEAVLNPMQTEMFMGLRDALEQSIANSNGSMSGVNIENISISTASLNNNQDFKRAGESLADAFKSAIQRKGITVNTNKV